jgi:hypothetical protein
MTTVVTAQDGRREVLPSLTPAQVAEMVERIKANALQVSDVPAEHHPLLFARLQIAKNEARVSRQQDLHDHLSDAIWSLRLTPNMPEPEIYRADAVRLRPGEALALAQAAYAHSVPLVAAFRDAAGPGALARRLDADLIAAQRFWEAEERRLWEIHAAKFERAVEAQAALRELPDGEFVANERDAEIVALQQVWLVKAGAMAARKDAEIAEIRRRIAELRGRAPATRSAPIARISFRGRRTQKWKLFSGSSVQKTDGEQRLVAVPQPSEPGASPGPRDCLLRTGVVLSGRVRAPRPHASAPSQQTTAL